MTDGIVTLLRAVPLRLPWMGGVFLVVVLTLMGTLWHLRTRHLSRRRRAAVPLAGVGTGVAGWLAIDVVWHPVADSVGPVVWTWVGLLTAVIVQVALGGAPAGAERPRGRRRLARVSGSAASLLTVVVAALLAINSFFAAYPSLAAVLDVGVTTTPLSQLAAAAALPEAPVRGEGMLSESWTAPAGMPAHGEVVTTAIPPGDQSGTRGFRPREAEIYLPPAYLTPQRPALPVLVILTGQPGSPSEWFELGGLKDTLDSYAAAHDGLAPVVVAVDLLGSPYRNPLCSDTERGGRVAAYLERDVPEWIRTNLQVDPDPRHWAIVGASNGGTCALQVTARDPQVYRTFLALSPEEHPSLGTEHSTIRIGFGGDAEAYAANDPASILAAAPAGTYDGVAGVVAVGARDKHYAGAASTMADLTARAGMEVSLHQYPGGHSWAFWSDAMAGEMDWLGERLQIAQQ